MTITIARASILIASFTVACTQADQVEPIAVGSSGPLSGSESDEGGPAPDMDAAKNCTCRARCIEFNKDSEKISFYNVDYSWMLGATDTCEVTQLIKDYLYYECMNSVIHPDYAELDPDPNFNCRIE